MARKVDRRSFIAGGVKTAVGAAAIGGGVPSLLAGCGSSGQHTNSGSTPIPASPNVGISSLPPKRGGQLNVGTYSEMSGLAPASPTSRFDATGFSYANAVYDPLAVLAMDGTVRPYLAESFTPNATYDQWTIKMRPNVVFHDGTPCDADALIANINALRVSILTGAALKPITNVVKVDDLTATVVIDQPWVAFPAELTSQGGYLITPRYINPDGSLNPQAAAQPIGTGPFVLQQWEQNFHFTCTRNPHYWRPGLPYLDSIVFRPIPDDLSRESTLKSGGIDVMHSQDPANYVDLAGNPQFQVYNDAHGVVGEPSIDCLIINCQSGPTSDQRVREALAYASNRDAIRQDFFYNIPQLATDGLFMPGDPWYQSGSPYPSFNPSKARELLRSYQADNPGPVNIQIYGPSVTRYVQIMEAFQQMWQNVGFTVSIKDNLQSTYTDDLVFGNYEVGLFQFFDAADPDENYPFFVSTNVGPKGSISLNLARYANADVDKYLNIGRTNPDPQARIEAYKNMNSALIAGLPYLFGWQTLWIIAADQRTMNFRGLTLPDGGGRAVGFNAGSMNFTETWLNT